MLKISGNRIELTKGDSAYITVNITYADGSPYTMQASDKLKFTVKKDLDSEVLMAVESATNTIHVAHSDSKNLIPGLCYGDIQLKSGEDIYTLFGVVNEDIPNVVVYPEVTED